MALTDAEMYDRLGRFLETYRFEALPPEVMARACMVIMDTIGVMLRGSAEADASALAAFYPETPGGATVFSPAFRRIDPPKAVMVNATMAAAQELTEGNRFSRGHFAVQTLPGVLAQAEVGRATGRAFIAAFVLAYEIAARIGAASERSFSVYGHGMWAPAGTAAGVGLLRGLPPWGVLECIKIGSNMALAPAFQTHFEGATVRNTTAGMGSILGFLVPDLQRCGYLGSEAAMAITFGQTLGRAFSQEAFVQGLGERYQISRNYIKFHASGRHMHAATDAMRDALHKRAIGPDDIEAIDVYTYYPASLMSEQDPWNALASKMSIPYSIAALVTLGETSADAYTPEARANPVLRALMRRVRVQEDKALSARDGWGGEKQHVRRSARVHVRLRDGSTVEGECENPVGDFDFPPPPGAVRDKFLKLVAPRLGESAAARIWERGLRLDEEADIHEFVRWMSVQA